MTTQKNNDLINDPVEKSIPHVKANIKEKAELERIFGKDLQEINHNHFNRFIFQCVMSGDWVSAADLRRYNYDVSLVLCEACEKKCMQQREIDFKNLK